MGKTEISFPILNNLTPTVESCTMKVLEEVGELMQLIGKGQGLSGEKITYKEYKLASRMVSEALDVAQSAITMAYALEERYSTKVEPRLREHKEKLIERGYLKC